MDHIHRYCRWMSHVILAWCHHSHFLDWNLYYNLLLRCFLCERHLGHVPWSLRLSFICIPQMTRALDQGGVEPRQADAVAKRYRPWPKGLRADSLPWFDSPWSRARVDCGIQIKLKMQRPGHTGRKALATKKKRGSRTTASCQPKALRPWTIPLRYSVGLHTLQSATQMEAICEGLGLSRVATLVGK